MRQMKFVLNLYGPTGASLCVESDCIDDIASAYVSVQRLTASGVLPLLQMPPVNSPGTPTRADNGDVEASLAPLLAEIEALRAEQETTNG